MDDNDEHLLKQSFSVDVSVFRIEMDDNDE
jgi:hypothetical protein